MKTDWTQPLKTPRGKKVPGHGPLEFFWVSSESPSTTLAGVDLKEFIFPIILLSGIAGERLRQVAREMEGRQQGPQQTS